MRLVNLQEWKRPVAQIYNLVEQPMPVYHSTEELDSHEQNVVKILTFGQFFDYAHANNIPLKYSPMERYVNVIRHNIWIGTVDNFIPDVADSYGEISYLQRDGQKIPTDRCWIRLYFITPTPARFVLYTSAGVNTIGLTKWQPTAAIRPTFIQESIPSKKGGSSAYEEKLEKLQHRRKPNVKFTQLAFAIFSSDSETFMDMEKSLKTVFGNSIRSSDREKLLSSPAFKEAVMLAIKTLYPSLRNTIQKSNPPEEMAEKLKVIWETAVSSKSVKDMLTVFEKISDIGYAENGVISAAPALPIPQNQTSEFPDPHKLSEAVAEDEDDPKTEEEIEKIKEELDYPPSFIMEERES